MKNSKKIAAVFWLVLGAGCGLNSAPTTADPTVKLSTSDVVWYSEHGASFGVVPTADGDLLVPAPADGSTSVQGVFHVEVPDRPSTTFSAVAALVGHESSADTLHARIYVQDGDQFPVLTEVELPPDGRPISVTVDLSAYRGEHRLLMLSVFSVSGEPLRRSVTWMRPELRSP